MSQCVFVSSAYKGQLPGEPSTTSKMAITFMVT